MYNCEESVISLQKVTKTFRYRVKSNDTIRDRVKYIFSKKYRETIRELQAINNISLKVQRGEFYGLVGHNGSGKSTLLKLILGAIEADSGSTIITKGKIVRLALGMGFDPNLSARHNIYVNGTIMGLTFREIGRKFDEIIDFAGLIDFVDTPIKFYSSGMVSRLSFSIAMHVEADILLIDEFFGGVGDENFRQKSEKAFSDRILKGKTILFVSHDMSLIQKYCHRVCHLDKGRVVRIGRPSEVVDNYINSYAKQNEEM